MKNKLQKALLTTTLLVIGLFTIGSYFKIFENTAWYDEIVHFTAGAWGAVILIWIFTQYKEKIPFYKKFKESPTLLIIFLVILVGIAWEFFEFGLVEYAKTAYDYRIGLQPSHFDTFTDLIMDGLGAWFMVYKFKKKSF